MDDRVSDSQIRAYCEAMDAALDTRWKAEHEANGRLPPWLEQKPEEALLIAEPTPLLGMDPRQDFGYLRIDVNGFVQLGDDQVDRIAERVVALLYERNRAGRG